MPKIAISAGELSGDEHAANLVRALRQYSPQCEVRGMGGRNLRAAGVEIIVDSEKSASLMGFLEVLGSAHKVFQTWSAMKRLLFDWRPDLLILVDYPDFNLRLAKVAKSLKIKVFYYITPKLWAWRAGRAKLFPKLIDQAAVILPFEPAFFREHGFARATFVGHPFVEQLKRCQDLEQEKAYRRDFLQSCGLDPAQPVLAIFPGSRPVELKRHLLVVSAAINALQNARPGVQAIIAVTENLQQLTGELLPEIDRARVKTITGRPLDVIRCADAGLMKSGTSNLQAAFFGLPFLAFYKASLFAEGVFRLLVRVPGISLVNIIRPQTLPEVLQRDTNPRTVSAILEDLLFNEEKRREIQNGLCEVVRALGSHDDLALFDGCSSAGQRAAKLALSVLA